MLCKIHFDWDMVKRSYKNGGVVAGVAICSLLIACHAGAGVIILNDKMKGKRNSVPRSDARAYSIIQN